MGTLGTDLYLKVSAVGSDATPPLTVLVTVLVTLLKSSETFAPTLDPVDSTVLNSVSAPEDEAPPVSTSLPEYEFQSESKLAFSSVEAELLNILEK